MQTYRVNESQMCDLARGISVHLRPRDVVCLQGDLGAGKSTLARHMIRAMVGDTVVPSPTFTLVQTYTADVCDIWHMDWYRLNTPEDVLELGIDEAFYTAINLIEWADKAMAYIPRDALHIALSGNGNTRMVHITGGKPHHAQIKVSL